MDAQELLERYAKGERDFRDIDLSGVDLSNANLEGINLSEANLTGANLQGANIIKANLSRVNLENADLSYIEVCVDNYDGEYDVDPIYYIAQTNISFSNLYNANLIGANLTGAILRETDFNSANLTNANFSSIYTQDEHFDGVNHINVWSVWIETDLKKTNFKNANLTNAQFNLTNLSKVKFYAENNLTKKWLLVWNLVNKNIGYTDLKGMDLSDANLRQADLKNVNLSKANLSKSDLRNIDLKGVNLSEANLDQAHLEGINLTNANLAKVNISNAKLYFANLERANLSNANLEQVNAYGANLHHSDLSGAYFKEVNFSYDENYNPYEGYFGYLKISDLANTNLSKATLENCNLDFARFTEAHLSETTIINCSLIYVNFRGANINNCKLTASTLDGSDFTKASIKQAYFEDCNLNDSQFLGVCLIASTFVKCRLIASNMFRTNIVSDMFNFKAHLVVNSNFYDCDLSRSNLALSCIDHVNFQNVIARHTNFAQTNISNSDFTNADLYGANLADTTFENCILKSANLEKTLLDKNYQLSPIKSEFNYLLTQQKDFINRYKQGYLLESALEGSHSEITTISTEETAKLREFSWEMVDKYKQFKQNAKSVELFVNNLTGKLGEALLKYRLGNLVTEVDYKLYNYGDGGVDFTLKDNANIGIQVKTRSGNLTEIYWSISNAEIAKNSLLVCVLSEQKISEAQPNYRLIFAGFIPTSEINIEGEKAYLSIEQLYYGGGIYSYLEHLVGYDRK